MFGVAITTKWYVTQDIKGTTYYLSSADDDVRHLVWSQQVAKAIKFDTSADAEKVMEVIKTRHKNNKNKVVYKVK